MLSLVVKQLKEQRIVLLLIFTLLWTMIVLVLLALAIGFYIAYIFVYPAKC